MNPGVSTFRGGGGSFLLLPVYLVGRASVLSFSPVEGQTQSKYCVPLCYVGEQVCDAQRMGVVFLTRERYSKSVILG